jgi:hypothetical protein
MICVMPILTPILIAAAVALVAWLVLTWWNTPTHHTFKDVVQHALRDVRDVFRLDHLFAFATRAANVAFAAVVALDGLIAQTPELKQALIAAGPLGWLAYSAVNLAVTINVGRASAVAAPAAPADASAVAAPAAPADASAVAAPAAPADFRVNPPAY